jgi:hypothetical protein
VTLGVLDLRRAGDEQEVLEDLADERILAEDPKGGRIRAGDVPVGVCEKDPVGECDERFREGRLVEGRVLAPPAEDPAALALR